MSAPSARPLRVLQVVQRFAPELGGLETHVAEVTTRLLAEPDIDVTVLTTDRTGRLPREERIGGVRVLRRRSWRRGGEEYFSPGIVRVIRRGGWDLVHVQGSQTTVPTLAMLAARSAGIPYVVTFHSGGHSSAAHAPITAVQHRINRPLLARAAALIAVSRFERSRFQAITGLPIDRFAVIPNGGALPPAPAAAPVPGRIVTSGRLERYKGHHRAIAALPIVRETIPGATLTVLGSGPQDAALRALAQQRGVADAVEFRHLLPGERAEMAGMLAASSVMAALSTYEAHPVGVMEAVALGLPVVGFDVAGIGDLVEDGLVDGVALDAGDREIADALVRAMQAAAPGPHRPPAVELPTWERCAAEVAAVYRRVAGAPTTPRLRVAQIITTLTTGGAERQLESIVRTSRHDQRVIALYGGGEVADGLRAAGFDVEVLDLRGVRRLVALPVLLRALQRIRPDVVQVHLLSAQLWGLLAARLAGLPTISTEHSLMDDSIENRPLSPALRRLYLALATLASRIVAVSPATRDRLVRFGVARRRISVIDNGIDFAALAHSPADRAATRRALGVTPSVELVGAVGRLEAVKRFAPLLDALAPTLSPGRRELVLVGQGPLHESLAAQAAALGVADAVHLLGARTDVPRLLAAMDVVVSPSRDETFGIAAIEAFAAGLPVVHAQLPALDALQGPVPGSLPIDAARQQASIREQVDAALRRPAGDRAAPEALRRAYDIRRTTARLDALADALATTRKARP